MWIISSQKRCFGVEGTINIRVNTSSVPTFEMILFSAYFKRVHRAGTSARWCMSTMISQDKLPVHLSYIYDVCLQPHGLPHIPYTCPCDSLHIRSLHNRWWDEMMYPWHNEGHVPRHPNAPLGTPWGQCIFFPKWSKTFLGYFDPEEMFLDNEYKRFSVWPNRGLLVWLVLWFNLQSYPVCARVHGHTHQGSVGLWVLCYQKIGLQYTCALHL